MSFIKNLKHWITNHYDDLGTLAGFALGGPAGAALGRAVGSNVGPEHKDQSFLHRTLGGAAVGLGEGELAGLLPGPQHGFQGFLRGSNAVDLAGEGAISSGASATGGIPQISSFADVEGPASLSATPAGATTAAKAPTTIGGYLRNAGQYFSDPKLGMQRTVMAGQAAGALGNAYNSYQQGNRDSYLLNRQVQNEDEQKKRDEQARLLMTPYLQQLAQTLQQQLQRAGYRGYTG